MFVCSFGIDEHSRASDLFGLNRFVEIGEEVSATLMLSSRGFNRCAQEIYWFEDRCKDYRFCSLLS